MPNRSVRASARVFVSYSRADADFAAELVAGLEACGFDPFIDTDDIVVGEDWQARLASLIESADTVLLLISPESMHSEYVIWEVEESQLARKRIIPVVCREVDMERVPRQISKLNFCFFTNAGFGESLRDLASTLRVDVDWIREHTRIGSLAKRWTARGEPEELLLRGQELASAREWRVTRLSSAPELTDSQAEFIDASIKAHEDAEREARYRQRRTILIASGITITMTLLAVFGFTQWREADYANRKLKVNIKQLERTNGRLTQGRELRLGMSYDRHGSGNVGRKWFSVAYRHEYSVVVISATLPDGATVGGSGFIVNARSLNPDWPEKPVLMTARFVVPLDGDHDFGQSKSDYLMSFPSIPDLASKKFGISEVLFASPDLDGVSVFQLADELVSIISATDPPSEVNSVNRISGPDFLDGIHVLGRDFEEDPNAIPDWPLSDRIALSYASELGRPPSFRMMRLAAIDNPVSAVASSKPLRKIWMPHTTAPGASGAPLFNAETGDLVGVHVVGKPTGLGSGALWIGDVIDEIRP